MTRWISLGALGVLVLVLGMWLLTSGASEAIGQVLGLIGIVLILLSVAVLSFAPRTFFLPKKYRGIVWSVGIARRLLTALVVLVAAFIAFVLFMRT